MQWENKNRLAKLNAFLEEQSEKLAELEATGQKILLQSTQKYMPPRWGKKIFPTHTDEVPES